MRAMSSTLIVMLGGALGAAMRYHLSRSATHWLSGGLLAGWPAATLLVNVSGSLAMGVLRERDGQVVAIEVKRRGEIDGVEQLGRYIERLHLDSTLGQVRGVFVAQVVKPQARVLAESRGFRVVEVDYDELRGMTPDDLRLF